MELTMLVILMVAISIIAYNLIHKKANKQLLEKTMSINPKEMPIKSDSTNVSRAPYSQFHYKPCVMTTILKIVGVINIVAGVILGIEYGRELGTIMAICIIFSGIIGCIFWFALAKCVEAAHQYLNRF